MVWDLNRFWNDEIGQDLVEYSLLIAFIALAIVQLIINGGKSMNGIWSATNADLAAGNAAITGGS
jgi:Flp pilus assembly pilin Flp